MLMFSRAGYIFHFPGSGSAYRSEYGRNEAVTDSSQSGYFIRSTTNFTVHVCTDTTGLAHYFTQLTLPTARCPHSSRCFSMIQWLRVFRVVLAVKQTFTWAFSVLCVPGVAQPGAVSQCSEAVCLCFQWKDMGTDTLFGSNR